MSRSVRSLVLFFLGLTVASAQNTSGNIAGLVEDPSGAVIPNAEISVKQNSTGEVRTTRTTGSGEFSVTFLQPGSYSVTASAGGFKSKTLSDITLRVDQTANLRITLEIGSSTETVEVTGAAPLVDSATSSLGQVIENKQIIELPLNARNPFALGLLSGNTTPMFGMGSNLPFIAGGGRFSANEVTLDGIDNNTVSNAGSIGRNGIAVVPSVDAVQEFKVKTSTFSAEFGHAAGAVVNASIKSGTNQFHGTAFEFLRNDAFDARDFFASPTAPKPLLRQNQFGGTLGGPILRNKLFFFGSFERTRTNSGDTQVLTVPSQAVKGGNFAGQPVIYDPDTTTPSGSGFARTAFAGSVIPTNRIDPVAAKLLALEPLPTRSGNANNYIANPINTDRINRIDVRGDDHISDIDQLFARYSYQPTDSVTPGPFPAPLIGSTNFQTANKHDIANGAALGETHTFSPTVVNEFRLGYNRVQDDLTPYVTDFVNPQFGILGVPQLPGVTGLPKFTISGFAGLGEATFLPNDKISETATLEDHVSWVKGKHSLSAGGTYRWVR